MLRTFGGTRRGDSLGLDLRPKTAGREPWPSVEIELTNSKPFQLAGSSFCVSKGYLGKFTDAAVGVLQIGLLKLDAIERALVEIAAIVSQLPRVALTP
jgi:hypothetical protein